MVRTLTEAKEYASEVIEEYDLSFDRNDIEIRESGRLTRSHGRWYHKPDRSRNLIKLSSHAFENCSVEEIKRTIRHELAHEEDFRNREETGHDFIFREYAREMNFTIKASEKTKEYEYLFECQDCQAEVGRYRRSKFVKKHSQYSCGKCGGDFVRVR